MGESLIRELNRQDLSDLLHGCAILGTGGGGELAVGFGYVDAALDAGKTFRLVDLDEIPDGSMICTPYMLGALVAETDDHGPQVSGTDQPAIMTAFERLQDYSGKRFFGTVACELGAENTAVPAYLAAMADGYLLDADAAGRAVPEITHSTYYLNGLDAAPIVMANAHGECFICENVPDDRRAEEIVRALARISGNDIAVIDHAMDVAELRNALVKGTLSRAINLGRTLREARRRDRDIAAEVATTGGGYVAFRGVVSDCECRSEDGFTVGAVMIDGCDEWAGHCYEVGIKNENLVSRLDGELHVTIPELICLLNLDDNDVLTNLNHRKGMRVAVVVLPAPDEFTTERGLAVFGPAYLGLDVEFRPTVEDVTGRNP